MADEDEKQRAEALARILPAEGAGETNPKYERKLPPFKMPVMPEGADPSVAPPGGPLFIAQIPYGEYEAMEAKLKAQEEELRELRAKTKPA